MLRKLIEKKGEDEKKGRGGLPIHNDESSILNVSSGSVFDNVFLGHQHYQTHKSGCAQIATMRHGLIAYTSRDGAQNLAVDI